MKAELFLDAGAELAEGPVWHDETLWWVDIPAGTLNRGGPDGGGHEQKKVAGLLGAAVPTRGGRWLLADEDGLSLLDWAAGDVERVSDVISHEPSLRFNDGKTDPTGAFWGGTLSLDGTREAGAFYRFAGGGSAVKQFNAVTCSNGLDFSDDQQTLYFVDTGAKKLECFDADLAAGTLASRRTLVDIPEAHGNPDGLTLDAEGNVWLALWGGRAVRCYDGRTGDELARVEVPAEKVTSCCFGGDDLQTLYITTAAFGDPAGGKLYACRPGVAGRAVNLFDDAAWG